MVPVINDRSVLDAFAGAGGFSLGFQLAGCRVVGCIEQDKWAAETFARNHPNATVLVSSIEQLTDEDIQSRFSGGSPDIIIGGPPCQGFSVCCRQTAGDPTDPRNSLFSEFLRLGAIFSPGLMVMENVPNLVNAKTKDRRLVIEIIADELEMLGYSVEWKVLQATSFGVPQMRQRLFVVASKTARSRYFPIPTHSLATDQGSFETCETMPTPTLWDAISDLPVLEAGEGSAEMDYPGPPGNKYQAGMRNGSSKVFNHTAMRHSKRMVARFASMKCGQSVSDVAHHLKPLSRNGNGHISGRAYDQNNRRMHPDRPCHTIPASFYANFVHPYQHRNFTPREGARLQSFPDWYAFAGKPTVVSHKLLAREERWEEKFLCQYSQIGNAVPPLLAKAIAENLIGTAVEEGSLVCA
jgi:DNA (cytosine-5)-methyltransferase 1